MNVSIGRIHPSVARNRLMTAQTKDYEYFFTKSKKSGQWKIAKENAKLGCSGRKQGENESENGPFYGYEAGLTV